MSDERHSPEPWVLGSSGDTLYGADEEAFGYDLDRPNARRIVACVNFLRQISTAQLELFNREGCQLEMAGSMAVVVTLPRNA